MCPGDHCASRTDASTRSGFELWVVLNFALWHRHWIENDDLHEVESVALAGVGA